tara:strand:- start:11457 stop:12647 length:1191 start_codon:yes stop_codon:yes gene_type:complete
MYDLQLSEEQLAIRDTVRDFVANEITPVALLPKRLEPFDPPLPTEQIEKAAELGLRSLSLSEESGGANSDSLTQCIVAEELAAGDADVAAVLSETSELAGPLFDRAMTSEQKNLILPKFLENNDFHLALAPSRMENHSAIGIRYHRQKEKTPNNALEAKATEGGGWLLNGICSRVSNAPIAKLFAIEAQTDSGSSFFLISNDQPGLKIVEVDRDGGWYLGSCGDVLFEDCFVSEENRLSSGSFEFSEHSPISNALNLGIARAAFDAAVEYAKLRIQGGRPIIEHQAIGEKLAEIAISLEVARGTIWRAAWYLDNPDKAMAYSGVSLPINTIAHVSSSEMLYRAAKDSAECFGAMGVMRDMPMQKYIHQTRMFLHTGNGNADSRLKIAELIADFQNG